MPELIDDTRTGFLVDDADEAVLAFSRAATLDRCAVRQEAVARFGRDRMVDAYLEVCGRGDQGSIDRRPPARPQLRAERP